MNRIPARLFLYPTCALFGLALFGLAVLGAAAAQNSAAADANSTALAANSTAAAASLDPALSPQADSVRSTTELFPGDRIVERGAERWLCTRVVDDRTGLPIAGAQLFLVTESNTPIAGTFWSTRQAQSDAEGFVRVRVDDIAKPWPIQVLRAEGYGVSSRSSPGEPIWRLAPAQDVPVLVHDWRGLPVAGAVIGFCGSCGHGPDLVNATSDANGIAILRGIDPHNDIVDLYCQSRGLGLGYESIRWRPGDPPFEFTCEYAPPLTGKLVDSAGRGIFGAYVGVRDVDRGPWAKTGADGTFEIVGAPEGTWPSAVVDGRDVWFPRPAAFPAVFHVPAAGTEHDNEGTVDDPAPEASSTVATKSIAVRVEGGDDEAAVEIVYPTSGFRAAKDGHIEVPTSGPFVVRVGNRRLAFGGISELPQEPLVLRDFAPTIVRGTVVDALGRAVSVRASLDPRRDEPGPEVRAPDGVVEFAVRKSGKALLELVPEVAGLRTRLVQVTLPARGDGLRLDLGKLELSAEPRLRVLAADGTPRTDVEVSFARPGYEPVGAATAYSLDDAGGWTGPDLGTGDAIVVTPVLTGSSDAVEQIPVTFRTVLTGDGPWVITPPTAMLQLNVHGLTSEDEACVVLKDHAATVGPTSTWMGLPEGPTKLWISAPGRQTAIVTTTILKDGKKTLSVELQAL